MPQENKTMSHHEMFAHDVFSKCSKLHLGIMGLYLKIHKDGYVERFKGFPWKDIDDLRTLITELTEFTSEEVSSCLQIAINKEKDDASKKERGQG
jgi:uncharacterized protein with HEPN domain